MEAATTRSPQSSGGLLVCSDFPVHSLHGGGTAWLVCERLRCEPWRPWGWGETTRGLEGPRAGGWGIETGKINEGATRMLRAAC